MAIQMPSVIQTPSLNYTPKLIAHSKVILHRTEGGTAEGATAWLCRKDARASTHLVSRGDGTKVYQLVPLQYEAWGECSFNGQGISIEYPGYTAQGVPDALAEQMGIEGGWLLRAYGLPMRHAAGGQGDGLCHHHDLGEAGGGHTDVASIDGPDWQKIMAATQKAYDAFGAGPLPPFAVHGLPNPHMVQLPPEVAPEPSHGGAVRAAPDAQSAAHPTLTGYPVASIHDWQERLRIVGANPTLLMDDQEGGATRAAIGTFQRAAGLKVTNEVNADTWKALFAMSEKLAA